jgi:hypothetical protein
MLIVSRGWYQQVNGNDEGMIIVTLVETFGTKMFEACCFKAVSCFLQAQACLSNEDQ